MPKVWRVRSFEDKVIEYIQSRFREQESETETKQNYSSWQEAQNQQKDQGLNHRDNNNSSGNSYLGKKEFSPDKKGPTELKKGNNKSKYDRLTKEELIKIIHELETEIRQLKSEKVEKSELPEFNSFLVKKEKQLEQKKEALKEMLSLDNGLEKDNNNSQLGSMVFKGIILTVIIGVVMLVIFFKNKKKRF